MSMRWFDALKGYEHAMRVDEDVCVTQLPSRAIYAALLADYAFGLITSERHRETVETFNPWLRANLAVAGLEPTIPPLPTTDIYFTNVFVSRVGFWHGLEVRRFLDAVNDSGGIYSHRESAVRFKPIFRSCSLVSPPASTHRRVCALQAGATRPSKRLLSAFTRDPLRSYTCL